jgi:hypothetical protein
MKKAVSLLKKDFRDNQETIEGMIRQRQDVQQEMRYKRRILTKLKEEHARLRAKQEDEQSESADSGQEKGEKEVPMEEKFRNLEKAS